VAEERVVRRGIHAGGEESRKLIAGVGENKERLWQEASVRRYALRAFVGSCVVFAEGVVFSEWGSARVYVCLKLFAAQSVYAAV